MVSSAVRHPLAPAGPIDLEEGDDVQLLPEIVCRIHAVNLTTHRALEEDHTHELARSKGGGS